LPCPFCGGVDLFRVQDGINATDRVVCKNCKASAILWKWNVRATPTSATPNVSDIKLAQKIARDFPYVPWDKESELSAQLVAIIATYRKQEWNRAHLAAWNCVNGVFILESLDEKLSTKQINNIRSRLYSALRKQAGS
jgi:hypothetical protein